jgi:hypothetical protein
VARRRTRLVETGRSTSSLAAVLVRPAPGRAVAVEMLAAGPRTAAASRGSCWPSCRCRCPQRSWGPSWGGRRPASTRVASTARSSAAPDADPPAASSPPLASACPPRPWPLASSACSLQRLATARAGRAWSPWTEAARAVLGRDPASSWPQVAGGLGEACPWRREHWPVVVVEGRCAAWERRGVRKMQRAESNHGES